MEGQQPYWQGQQYPLAADAFHPRFLGLPADEPTSPAPFDAWGTDLLGPGFQARSLRVPYGEGVATLVRHVAAADPQAIPGTPGVDHADGTDQRARPRPRPAFVMLYVHGWNDYFFQREMARHIALSRGAFYALDLHGYGRSLRQDRYPGWCRSLSEYSADFAAALGVIRAENPGAPLVMAGHSTGGLIATLWMLHNAASVHAAWLNSPWLELQVGPTRRAAYQPVFKTLTAFFQHGAIPLKADQFYGRSLRGWDHEFGPLPKRYGDYAQDPSLAGFTFVPRWKNSDGNPLLLGWASAILAGQAMLAEGGSIGGPLLIHASTRTLGQDDPAIAAQYSDAVLNTDVLLAAGAKLSADVQIRRHPGKHDLLLSFPDVRQAVWRDVHQWLARVVPGCPQPADLSAASVNAICP